MLKICNAKTREQREIRERERQTDRKTDRDAHSIHIFEFRLSNGEDCERKSEHHKYSTNVHFSLSLSLFCFHTKNMQKIQDFAETFTRDRRSLEIYGAVVCSLGGCRFGFLHFRFS